VRYSSGGEARRMDSVEVAIVGAGPAGAATALFLLHHRPDLAGRVALLDRARFPRDKICAGAVGGRALKALATIGVVVAIPHVAIRGLGVVTARGRLAIESAEAIGWVVRRRELDGALVAEATRRGAELVEGARLVGLAPQARGFRLDTTAGPIEAGAVVGADGVGSATRRLLGLDRRDVHAQAVEVDTPWLPDEDGERARLWFDLRGDHPGYAWDFPTLVDGRSLVCRGVYSIVHGVGGARVDPARMLQQRLERLGLEGGRVRRFAERGLPLAAPLAKGRALLVGEAAGIDPVLGEGIAQAILYGALAGRYLARRVEGDRPFDDWRREVRTHRVGYDLRARRALLPLVYGPGRPLLERWVTRSPALARAGAAYFAGERVPRRFLLRAFRDLVG
jgi:menaquinone-9 beta-reductase